MSVEVGLSGINCASSMLITECRGKASDFPSPECDASFQEWGVS